MRYAIPGREDSKPIPELVAIAGPRRWRLPLAAALCYVAIRGLAFAVTVPVLPHLPPINGQPYTLAFFIHSWDADRYTKIATEGYQYIQGDPNSMMRFAWFPGYPAAIDAFAWIPGMGPTHAAFLVAILSGVAAAVGLTLLVAKLTGNPGTGLLTAALWAAAPGSIVLEMNYPEALLCAVAAWGLYALACRRLLTAGLLAALAGTVHSTGAALIVAVAVAAIGELAGAIKRHEGAASWWRPATAMLLAPVGLLGYIGFVAFSFGRLDGWFYQEHRDHNGFDGGYSIAHMIARLNAGGPRIIVGPTLVVLGTCAAALVLTGWLIIARRRLGPVPPYVLWYAATIVFTALASGPGTFAAKPRFLLPALVLGLPPAALMARLPGWLRVAAIALITVATTWLSLYKMGPGWQV